MEFDVLHWALLNSFDRAIRENQQNGVSTPSQGLISKDIFFNQKPPQSTGFRPHVGPLDSGQKCLWPGGQIRTCSCFRFGAKWPASTLGTWRLEWPECLQRPVEAHPAKRKLELGEQWSLGKSEVSWSYKGGLTCLKNNPLSLCILCVCVWYIHLWSCLNLCKVMHTKLTARMPKYFFSGLFANWRCSVLSWKELSWRSSGCLRHFQMFFSFLLWMMQHCWATFLLSFQGRKRGFEHLWKKCDPKFVSLGLELTLKLISLMPHAIFWTAPGESGPSDRWAHVCAPGLKHFLPVYEDWRRLI